MELFFDEAAQKDRVGASVILVTPKEKVLPYAFTLIENCSNNVAECQALMLGLEMAIELKITRLKVFRDSKLIINQLLTLYEVKKLELLPYIDHTKKLLEWFDDVHVPRKENRQADALANLASAFTSSNKGIIVPLCKRWVLPPITLDKDEDIEANVVSILEIDEKDWRQPLIDYLQHGKLSFDLRHKAKVKCRAPRFIYFKDTLYRCLFDGVFLRCLDNEEASRALQEAHFGICGAHQSGAKLHFQIKRMGYY